MSMKTIEMDTLPQCNFCPKEAAYDEKTKMGPWAYLCEDHHKQHGTGLGNKLVKREKIVAPKTDKIPVVNIPISEEMLEDSLVTVQCPHCGSEASVEPDANYVKICDSCGNKYRVVSEI